jgi:hypothetical protein
VTERCAKEAPDRVAAEADRKKQEQQLTERLARHRPDRALLVSQLPGVADGDLEREKPDDAVNQAPRHEAGAREHLERRGTHEAAANTASGLNGCRADGACHEPGSTHFRRGSLAAKPSQGPCAQRAASRDGLGAGGLFKP